MSITLEEHLRTCLELRNELEYLFTPKKDEQNGKAESESKDEEERK